MDGYKKCWERVWDHSNQRFLLLAMNRDMYVTYLEPRIEKHFLDLIDTVSICCSPINSAGTPHTDAYILLRKL